MGGGMAAAAALLGSSDPHTDIAVAVALQ